MKSPLRAFSRIRKEFIKANLLGYLSVLKLEYTKDYFFWEKQSSFNCFESRSAHLYHLPMKSHFYLIL